MKFPFRKQIISNILHFPHFFQLKIFEKKIFKWNDKFVIISLWANEFDSFKLKRKKSICECVWIMVRISHIHDLTNSLNILWWKWFYSKQISYEGSSAARILFSGIRITQKYLRVANFSSKMWKIQFFAFQQMVQWTETFN